MSTTLPFCILSIIIYKKKIQKDNTDKMTSINNLSVTDRYKARRWIIHISNKMPGKKRNLNQKNMCKLINIPSLLLGL